MSKKPNRVIREIKRTFASKPLVQLKQGTSYLEISSTTRLYFQRFGLMIMEYLEDLGWVQLGPLFHYQDLNSVKSGLWATLFGRKESELQCENFLDSEVMIETVDQTSIRSTLEGVKSEFAAESKSAIVKIKARTESVIAKSVRVLLLDKDGTFQFQFRPLISD